MRFKSLVVGCLGLGLALVSGGMRAASAQESQQIKPYFLIMLDTSSSMLECTEEDSNGNCIGGNSCGASLNRISAAKCVLQHMVDEYGDAEFALGRFRPTGDPICTVITPANGRCNWSDSSSCSIGGNTADQVANPRRGQVLVPFRPENSNEIREWVDFTCDSCSTDATAAGNVEIDPGSGTPLTGAMAAAKLYYEGNDTDFAAGSVARNPIASDPFKACRPYRVILLTDGDASCAGEGGAVPASVVNAITGLRSTVVGGVTYDIKTDVIGFGIPPGNAAIEAYAQAGGRADGAGNEGFYAVNEADLALAISQIIEDSILVEVCDGIDNDCDGLIDEGFNVGGACDGTDTDQCKEGVLKCTSPTTVGCVETSPDNDTEVCNQLDDDCDGLVDEPPAQCPSCIFQPEICNNVDDNCNNMIDENLTRPCGNDVGECAPGVETCVAGNWVGCTGKGPTGETCDNKDNDCDGVVDGMTRDCQTTNQCADGVPCQCTPGQQVCSMGSFGTCIGAVGPGVEGCDGVDNDCDGTIDEDVPGLGGPCNNQCGAGVTVCVDGMVECVGGMAGMPEECNGIDDNCNGMVDEGLPDMGPCTVNDQGQELCLPGVMRCESGAYHCVGGEVTGPEICDCKDNDCDDEVDEGDLCSGDTSACLGGPFCQCAFPCDDGEFPCPAGYTCSTIDDERFPPPNNRFCTIDKCVDVQCQPDGEGNPTYCVQGECVGLCQGVVCPGETVCRPSDGVCVENNCNGLPGLCSDAQYCLDGVCVDNPCADVDCSGSQYCYEGDCVGSCAGIDCPPGQSCDFGMCGDDPCADVVCPQFQVCNPATGGCQQSRCGGVSCPGGQTCDPLSGECVVDRCNTVDCPGNQVCVDGSCFDPGQIGPPGEQPDDFVLATGGGGCECRVGQRGKLPGAALVLLVLPLLVLFRRRKEAR